MVIDRRFNGPPASANGGYACGVLAEALGGDGPAAGGDAAVAVTLRQPPPLDTPLERKRREDGSAALLRDGALVAEAARASLELTPPPAPSLETAARAADRYVGHQRHAFPTCFVCGPGRDAPGGLRIFAGPTGDDGMVAAPWTPPEDLGADGVVDPRIVWAALDCPTFFACASARPAVLGRLTARLLAPVAAGRPHVVAAWPLGRDGRKLRAASAVYRADGTPVAAAQAVWIELEDLESFGARA